MNKKEGYTLAEIKQKMAYYCNYQDRCHWEVEKKLEEFTLIPSAKDEIMLDLLQHDFLNEERFTKSFVRGKFYQKKWGKIKITQELKKRKINSKLITLGLKEINQEDYISTLQELLKKKLISLKAEKENYKKQLKIKNYLLQKGFEYELITENLNNI